MKRIAVFRQAKSWVSYRTFAAKTYKSTRPDTAKKSESKSFFDVNDSFAALEEKHQRLAKLGIDIDMNKIKPQRDLETMFTPEQLEKIPFHKLNEGDVDKFLKSAQEMAAQKSGVAAENSEELLAEGNKLLKQMGLSEEDFAKMWIDGKTREKVATGTASESEVQQQLLGKRIVTSHSAKTARQRRETGKRVFRLNARNLDVQDMLTDEQEMKEIKELEEKNWRISRVKEKRKGRH